MPLPFSIVTSAMIGLPTMMVSVLAGYLNTFALSSDTVIVPSAAQGSAFPATKVRTSIAKPSPALCKALCLVALTGAPSRIGTCLR